MDVTSLPEPFKVWEAFLLVGELQPSMCMRHQTDAAFLISSIDKLAKLAMMEPYATKWLPQGNDSTARSRLLRERFIFRVALH